MFHSALKSTSRLQALSSHHLRANVVLSFPTGGFGGTECTVLTESVQYVQGVGCPFERVTGAGRSGKVTS